MTQLNICSPEEHKTVNNFHLLFEEPMTDSFYNKSDKGSQKLNAM